jgi:hypothetical protein
MHSNREDSVEAISEYIRTTSLTSGSVFIGILIRKPHLAWPHLSVCVKERQWQTKENKIIEGVCLLHSRRQKF